MTFHGKRFILSFLSLSLFMTLIEIGPVLVRGEATTSYRFPVWVLPIAAALALRSKQEWKKS